MPIRIRWKNKEYIGIGLMLLGACGIFQAIFILIAQYIFLIGNYLTVIIIPIGVTLALFVGGTIIFEAFAQIERREKLKSQFKKFKGKKENLKKFFEIPVVRPMFIISVTFSLSYLITYLICILFLDIIVSFIFAENIGVIACLLIANYFEKYYARINRY
jgi:hypothetical protein